MCDHFVKHFLTATCHTCRAKVKVELTATVKKKNRRIVESGSKTSHSVLSFPFLPRLVVNGNLCFIYLASSLSVRCQHCRALNFIGHVPPISKSSISLSTMYNFIIIAGRTSSLFWYCLFRCIVNLFLPSESSKVGS